jgi:hypothetical protein
MLQRETPSDLWIRLPLRARAAIGHPSFIRAQTRKESSYADSSGSRVTQTIVQAPDRRASSRGVLLLS